MPALPETPSSARGACSTSRRASRPASGGAARLVALVALLAAAAPARAGLSELLGAVGENARFPTPTRADVRIECQPACKVSRAILVGRDDAIYLEVKDGLRALIRPGSVLVAAGARPAEPAAAKAIAETGILLEDLAVFTPASLKVPQISDEGPPGVVVTAAPGGTSPYVLLVDTIDQDRATIVRTQYYRDSISNLVKIRRDGGFVRVGDRWRPGDVTVQNLREDTSAHLTLAWHEVPDAPATLFEPAGLEHPSGLDWP